jgi:cytoskeleton-associated protein 5
MLLDYGLKAKVAKTRQGTLDELSAILKKSGMGACEPPKAFPFIAAMLSDKDPHVRKSALGTLRQVFSFQVSVAFFFLISYPSEAYSLVGEKVWSLVGPLSSKDKTQLEERLRRVPGPSSQGKTEPLPVAPSGVARVSAHAPRSASPSIAATSRIARPASPANTLRTASPVPSQVRSESPLRPAGSNPAPTPVTTSPGKARPRSMLPSRLGRPRPNIARPHVSNLSQDHEEVFANHIAQEPTPRPPSKPKSSSDDVTAQLEVNVPDEITLTISSILSSDPARSVDALKKIQKILSVGPDNGPSSPQYRELAEHTEGLIETITLQMAHIFEHPDDLIVEDNFRLAKHLIQTLNNFCDHSFLAESLTVDILTALLEELTLRLLETDDSPVKKIKELSRFINMIILRLFATGRRMSIFRWVFRH